MKQSHVEEHTVRERGQTLGADNVGEINPYEQKNKIEMTISDEQTHIPKYISQGTIRIEIPGGEEYGFYFSPSAKFSITPPWDEKKSYGVFIPSKLKKQENSSTHEESSCSKAFLVTEREVKIHGMEELYLRTELGLAAINKTLVEVKVTVDEGHSLTLNSISIPALVQK